MSLLNNLQEHLIHLIKSADEGTLVRLVRVLEGADTVSNTVVVTTPLDKLPTPRPHLAASSSDDEAPPLSARRDTADDNEEYGSDDDDGSMHVSRNQARRRIGVSAAPMPVMSTSFVPRVIPKTKEQADTVSAIVAGCHLFANMEEREREVIVNALERDEFPAGGEILKQGTIPSPAKFYIIFEGTLDVIKGGKHVASLVVGSTFGELEIMYNSECAATIRAVTPCVLYSLDQESYRNIVFKVSVEKQKKYRDLVENVLFLEVLSEYDKNTLAEALITSNYVAGDHIINFGEKGTHVHIIVEGEVQVIGREMGKKIEVIRLGPGNVIGELEFLFDHPTIADVVAATKKVQTAKISRKHFEMCVGPITDELKQFVAKKGSYDFYLREADESVRKEIEVIGKRTKRVEHGNELTIDKLDSAGEVIIGQHVESASGHKFKTAFRFPFKPLQNSSMLVIGMREDATIAFWSEAMERITNFSAAEVLGQSLYTFMLSGKEQQTLHTAITTATKHSGHIEDAYYESAVPCTYTIQRRDGLTKVKMLLQVVPPCVSHGKDVAEILLAVGHEVKPPPQQVHTDYSHWLTDQIRSTINDTERTGEDRLSQIGGLVNKFESLQKNATNAVKEDLSVVNVRQLIGQVVMNYSHECVSKRNAVEQNFEELDFEEVYCDAALLPDCLRFAMSNCVKHLTDCHINIKVCVVEDYGVEFLQISFQDDGPGFPKKVLDSFNGTGPEISGLALNNVRDVLEKEGGALLLVSKPGATTLTFKIPFIPNDDDIVDVDLGASASNASITSLKKQTFTTLVVEERPAHRNLLCAVLWERKHAVLPGYSWSDIDRLTNQTDILMVDVSQSAMSNASVKVDAFSLLREKARAIAIILTGENMDAAMREAAQQAGFFTLQKPCTQLQAVQVLRKAEDRICKMKAEREKIHATRAAFNQNNRGEWKKGALLGKGAFGEVFEAVDVLTGGKMAVKYLRVPKDTKPEIRQGILNEIEVMCTLQHPNIIHYFFAEDDVDNEVIKVVMEFASGGTLQGLLTSRGQLSHADYVALLRDIVEGVAYIHAQRYVHRDLKTPNVLLNSDGKGKLGDFGTAKRLAEGEEVYEMVGTLQYMAPEVLSAGEPISDDPDVKVDEDDENVKRVGYSYAADIWSLGCIALEMATNQSPFAHLGCMNSMATITQFITGLKDVPDLSPLFDKPPEIIEFVSACLNPDPAKRATAQQLLSFSIFQEVGSEEMKTAMKALKRAQLMAVLNAFVAFQDPEELAAKRLEEEEARKADQVVSRFNDDAEKQEDDFFADSEEEDDSDDDSGDSDGSEGESSSEAVDSGNKRATIPSTVDREAEADIPTVTFAPIVPLFSVDKPLPPDESDSAAQPAQSTTSTTSAPGGSAIHLLSFGALPATAAAIGQTQPAAASPPRASSDRLVICLHDALLMLVDQIRRSNSHVHSSDDLRAQYEEVARCKDAAECSDSTRASAPGQIFRPDILRLLEADAELIKSVADTLGQPH